MIDLPTILKQCWDNSKRAYGAQRPPHMPVHELQSRVRTVQENHESLYGWVDVILAGIEGGLRAGATPFALAQAIVNRGNEVGARKMPPPLPHMPESAK